MRARLLLLALLAAVALTPAAFPKPSAATPRPSQSSKALMLTPHIYIGQAFAWKGRISERHGPTNHYDSRTDIFTCTVIRGNSNTFIVSRQVKVFLPAFRPYQVDDPSKVIATTRPASMGLLPKPPIIIRNGREFNIDGPPLRDDPICMFYSVPMLGVPPSSLKIGDSWTFDRTTTFGSPQDVRGTATVTSLDAATGVLGLRVRMNWDSKGQTDELIDMVVRDGGVIVAETQRYLGTASTIPGGVGAPDAIVIWRLIRP